MSCVTYFFSLLLINHSKVLQYGCRYQLVSPADGMWGGPLPNGTVTGMIGMVARHEVHLAHSAITFTGLVCMNTTYHFHKHYG